MKYLIHDSENQAHEVEADFYYHKGDDVLHFVRNPKDDELRGTIVASFTRPVSVTEVSE